MLPTHHIHDHIERSTVAIAAEYARIRRYTQSDPCTAGDQGEENWRQLIANWLPAAYHVVTKGHIVDANGNAGPQVDVLILHPSYPRMLLDDKYRLAGGVVAAFECKTTLRTRHLKKAVNNAKVIKSLVPRRQGTPYRELNSPIFYGVLAHSSEIGEEASKTIDSVSKSIDKLTTTIAEHPREVLDCVCIADLATWTMHKNVTVMREDGSKLTGNGTAFAPHVPSRAGDLCKPYTAVGAFVFALFRRMAWENAELRDMAEYYYSTGMGGSGGGPIHPWGDEVLSPLVRGGLSSAVWGGSWNPWGPMGL